MKKCCVLLLALCLLAGCTPLLEREYSTVEPHSSKFWESEAAGTLRAENYQDIVNDLLILIGQHTETATLRLYNVENKLQAADLPASPSGAITRWSSRSATAGRWSRSRLW